MRPFATRESDHVKTHLTEELNPVGRTVQTVCGRRLYARLVWSQESVDEFRKPSNSHMTCKRCFR